ncbi:MAG: hypothetical protein AMXMBFR33_33560 [Candidatus Xenobia bacterium]
MSLRHRLAASVTLLCLMLLSLSGLAVYLGARRTMSSQLDAALMAVTSTEVASAVDGPRIHLHDTVGLRGGYQRYAQIVRPGGEVLALSDNLTQPLPRHADLESTTRPMLADLEWQGQPVRALFFPLEQQRAVAVVALPLAPVRHALSRLVTVLVAVLLCGSALAAGFSWWLACRITHPLEGVALAAQRIGPDQLARRLEPEPGEDREVTVLREALNAMLAQLEEAFRLQQQFLSDASHELRTPLTNLIGHLEVTLRRPRDAEQYRSCLERSLEEARRLARLVRDLLTLSQVDQGGLRLCLATVGVRELLEACRGSFEPKARERSVNLELEADSDLTVQGDADRLRQVLDNLVDNALRYAPEGSTVALRATAVEDGVELVVSDQGPGLPASGLFERFARPDPSRSRDTGGTGLGLAIVRSLVQAHGGQVTAESGPDRGASFRIRLTSSVRGRTPCSGT